MKLRLLLALPLLLVAAQGHAFKRSVTSSGGDVCLYWPQRTVVWHAASPLGAAAGDSALDALRASARSWSSTTCSDLALVEGDRSGRDIGYSRKGGNENVLLFRSQGSCAELYRGDPCLAEGTCVEQHDCWDYDSHLLAVTTTTFDRCGQLLDADIEFNGGTYAFTTADGPGCTGGNTSGCVAFDVQNTATHEMGHLLGLDHPDVAGHPEIKEDTMYASATTGEVKKRSLEPDDVDGLCTIYPTGAPAASCVSPRCDDRRPETSTCAAAGGGTSLLALALSALALPRRRRR